MSEEKIEEISEGGCFQYLVGIVILIFVIANWNVVLGVLQNVALVELLNTIVDLVLRIFS